MRGPIRIIKRLCMIASVLGAGCMCFYSGCELFTDESQLQVVSDPEHFEPFSSPPRKVAYGPYCLKVTQTGAVVAWGEAIRGGEPRHVAVCLNHLCPATEYFYRVNGAGKDGRFVTAPDNGDGFSFFVWGDNQAGIEVAKQLTAMMLELDPNASFALHTGDMVNNGYSLDDWESQWWQPMADFILQQPVYPTMGNHETDSEYYNRYFSELCELGANYSFDWGSVHVVVADLRLEDPDATIDWLRNDLAEHGDADFIMLSHHIPVYASTTTDNGSSTIQKTLAALCEEYEIDLVWNGHVHTYQHHFKDGTHYLVTGGGGARLYDYGLPLDTMTLKLYKRHNFVHGWVVDGTMELTAYDLDGSILDRFTISQEQPPEITARIIVSSDSDGVTRGDVLHLDILIQGAERLDHATCDLACFREEPTITLDFMDADPESDGIQIWPGELGGIVTVNRADTETGIVTYQEEHIGGFGVGAVRMATLKVSVPKTAPVASLYLVPQCKLLDSDGKEIQHFMGGVKVLIKANDSSQGT